LLYGKLYTLFGVKQVFLTALLLFELGSLLCALAPSSLALIMGRTVAGTGSSGIYMGSFVTLAHTIPLSRRPLFIGIIGGVFGLASVIGPLVRIFRLSSVIVAPRLLIDVVSNG
jgi:MFS family permease